MCSKKSQFKGKVARGVGFSHYVYLWGKLLICLAIIKDYALLKVPYDTIAADRPDILISTNTVVA